MKRRQNNVLTTGLSASAALGLGAAAWVGFRLYVRQELLAELEAEGLSEHFAFAEGASGLIGMDLNLPPPTAMAKAMVPLWSTVMPKEALYDISRLGRESQYWPAEYRRASPLAALGLERAAFAALAEHSLITTSE